jgi:hypothetical protein
MNNLIDILGAFIEKAWDYLCEIFITVILDTIVSFFSEVVDYFTSMRLEMGVQIPFMLGENSPVAEQLSGLKKNSQGGEGIYEGVFNEQTNQLDSIRWIEGKGLDPKIKDLLKEENIVTFN